MENKYRYNCYKCSNKCDGKSKGNYQFKNDVEFSEYYEKLLVKKINEKGHFSQKTLTDGYPDIEVFESGSKKVQCYIEVKAQRRTFMKVKEILPKSDLLPSETMVLNLSDLLRYFKIGKEVKVPIYIMWVLEDRSCVLKEKKVMCFYQDVGTLEEIYNKYGDKRKFRRKSGTGDIVEGQHKGVVVNYHFSLNELQEFKINKII